MSNNTNDTDQGSGTGSETGGLPCPFPKGFTGPPPPGVYKHVELVLLKIIIPIIIGVGTFGNVLTIIVLIRHMKKLTSTAMFLFTLALSDTLLLYNAPLRRWITSIWNEDIRHYTELGCKFSVYLTYTSIQFSSWLLVAVTVERFISVVWPHRVRLGCTPRNSAIVIGVLFLIIFGLNTHIFYGFGYSKLPVYNGEGFCEPLYEGYRVFWGDVYSWIDLAVAFAIPFGFFVVINSVIIYKLRMMRLQRRKMSIIKSKSEDSSNKDANGVTVMLIMLSVVFFLCLTPVSVYFIVREYWLKHIAEWFCIDIYEFFRLFEIHSLVYVIVNIIGYCNASVNFFLYIISGSKYRAEIKALLLCKPVAQDGIFGSSSSASQRRTTRSTIASESRYGSRSTATASYNGTKGTPNNIEEEEGENGLQQKVLEDGTINKNQGYNNEVFTCMDEVNTV